MLLTTLGQPCAGLYFPAVPASTPPETDGERVARRGPTFQASDTQEGLPGGHLFLYRWDAELSHGRIQGLELIGREPGNRDGYFMHS